MSVRVLLVDDDPLVRSGLRYLLGGADDVRVVGEAADGDEVPAAVRATAPDVVLMDLRMRRVDGVAATAAVRAHPGAPQVVVLTTFDGDAEVVGALRAGAAGYLLKDLPPADLVAAVRAAAAGDPVLAPAVLRRMIAMVGTRLEPAAAARLDALASGERAVARQVARGLSNRDIAAALALSPATVKAYLSRALATLDLTNRVQLALLVVDAEGPL